MQELQPSLQLSPAQSEANTAKESRDVGKPRSSPVSPRRGPGTVENRAMLEMGFRIRNFLSKLSKELKDVKSVLT